MARDQIISAVEALPQAIQSASGAALYTGWSALRPGPIYIMGLNPGGSPDEEPRSLIEDVLAVPDVWSSYSDNRWGGRKEPGTAPHQVRVRRIATAAGLDIRETPAANAIFVRSRNAGSLTNPYDLWRLFWPIHQRMLAIVRPHAIVCLGNGQGLSSWSLMRSCAARPLTEEPSDGYRSGRFAKATFSLSATDELTCTLIGVPHPSRFNVPSSVIAFLEANAAAVRSNR